MLRTWLAANILAIGKSLVSGSFTFTISVRSNT